MGSSNLHSLHDSIADPKYDSVKTTRDQLLSSKSGEDEEDEQDVAEEEDFHNSASDSDKDIEDEQMHASPQTAATSSKTQRKSSLESDGEEASQHQNQNQTLASSLRHTRAADKLKGKAVSRQLTIWDSLVDARIRMQKSVMVANKLPRPDNMGPYISSPSGQAATQSFLFEALQLSEELFELRHTLLAGKGLALPPRKKRKVDYDTEESNYETLIGDSTAEMTMLDAHTHSDTLSTLQKWSSKVQAVAPAALLSSSRVSFKSGPAHTRGAAELVEDALREPGKAIRRTWGKGDKVARIGGNPLAEEGEGDEEAFDDRDFYQGLLRDVIESKGGKDGASAADLYANSKKQKKRKAVDTKASKGRKLRYEPHEKLQHFMVPVPVRGAWHDEQIDELFASLLGRGFDKNTVNEEASRVRDSVGAVGPALQGFRVFG